MSGGYFNCGEYAYLDVIEFADELEDAIRRNDELTDYGTARFGFDTQTLEVLRSQVANIRKTAEIMKFMDRLFAGDDLEDTFRENLLKIEKDHDSRQ